MQCILKQSVDKICYKVALKYLKLIVHGYLAVIYGE